MPLQKNNYNDQTSKLNYLHFIIAIFFLKKKKIRASKLKNNQKKNQKS